MFCDQCGAQASTEAKFCQACGAALPGSEAAPTLYPVLINGITFTPGTGKYAGYYSGPAGWVTIENGKVKKATPGKEPPSTGRKIAGIACLAVAALAAIQGWSWLTGFTELEADGNPFSGILAILLLGALTVAAGFGIAGIVLLSGTKKS